MVCKHLGRAGRSLPFWGAVSKARKNRAGNMGCTVSVRGQVDRKCLFLKSVCSRWGGGVVC